MIKDRYGRSVNYMRLSVTDRCNLRCFYCSPGSGFKDIPHPNLLRYEELLEIIGLGVSLGVRKVRLTGGEPMVRRDFIGFLERARSRFPDLDLRLTTNGTQMAGQAAILRSIGLNKINISLDTLDRGKYERITGRDCYGLVRRAVDDCLEQGITVKVNAVALKGVNDDELPAFVDFARSHPVDLRFIEFMPIGAGTEWGQKYFWPVQDILDSAARHADLVSLTADAEGTHGPARCFAIEGGLGRLGFISPLSNHFCDSCNRLRITSQGSLRTCLFSDKEYRFRAMLRHPKLGIKAVEKLFRLAGADKPLGYALLKQAAQQRMVCSKAMSSIGG